MRVRRCFWRNLRIDANYEQMMESTLAEIFNFATMADFTDWLESDAVQPACAEFRVNFLNGTAKLGGQPSPVISSVESTAIYRVYRQERHGPAPWTASASSTPTRGAGPGSTTASRGSGQRPLTSSPPAWSSRATRRGTHTTTKMTRTTTKRAAPL